MADIIKSSKDVAELLTLFYKDLAQPSVQKLGAALGTVFEYVDTLTYSLKLRNERVKQTFQRNLDEVKQKIDDIPADKLIEVNTHLGVPIVERLSYITNNEIADLFTTLLSKAASEETINQAHPSFIQLIDRLSVDEARIIKFLRNENSIPHVTFKGVSASNGYAIVLEKATLVSNKVVLEFPYNELSYLENLVSMGILSDNSGVFFTDDKFYSPIRDKYLDDLTRVYVDTLHRFTKIEPENSYFKVTAFGKHFIKACTI